MSLPRQPRWVPADRLHLAGVPAGWRVWLLDSGSLTTHVMHRCPDGFHVRVLREFWRRARRDEAHALRMRPDVLVRVREVVLHCHRTPMVVARTVMPRSSLRGRQQRLIGTGRRPLGALLFADRSMHRGRFSICRTTLAQAGLPVVTGRNLPVRGRRAVFHLGSGPLLVAEFFLPGLGIDQADAPRRRTGSGCMARHDRGASGAGIMLRSPRSNGLDWP